MDHWGDPWADNHADHQKSPIKFAIPSPQQPPHASAPVLVNACLDDAGWGNEEESFGDWTTPPAIDASAAPHVEPHTSHPSPVRDGQVVDDAPRWHVEERKESAIEDSEATWAEQSGHAPSPNNGISDTSETPTTIQADTKPERDTRDTPARSQPEDSASARPSTSQSETSRHEAPVESSRTSLEEERSVEKDTRQNEEEPETVHKEKSEEEVGSSSSESDGTENEFGTSTADTILTEGAQSQSDAVEEITGDVKEDTHEHAAVLTGPTTESPPTTASPSYGYQVDPALFDELFPPQKVDTDLGDAPEDPVYSTSGRKAWYRLTRKQTMREFNSGNGDDNYIRVTWVGSQVRAGVHKTIARWAREDRLSGTGAGARASFYWDTPAPVEPRTVKGHQRTKTSIPTQRIAAPMRQSLPSVATNTAAAFNWSSPVSTLDPWKQDSPALYSVPPPAAPKPITPDNEQKQEHRAVSIDLTRGVGEAQGRTSTTSLETPVVARIIAPPLPTTTSADALDDFSVLDTNTVVPEQRADVPDDDDDDWGDMISSADVPAPIPAFPISVPTPRDDVAQTLTSAPETLPDQDPSTDAMHTATIVRLKSTISPTSAIFGRKSFVPLGVEQGPIGPGILKPAKRRVTSTPEKPEKPKSEAPPKPSPDVIPFDVQDDVQDSVLPVSDASDVSDVSDVNDVEQASKVEINEPEPVVNHAVDQDFSVFESSTLEPEPATPKTPPRAPTIQSAPVVDAWADADFSFFESAPLPPTTTTTTTTTTTPTTTTTRSVHLQPNDASDPFSVFQTPPRSTSSASSAKTFARSSPPRNITPPATQPLTGATNSAQRRKNEQDRIIRDILGALPDLNYMLLR
ncbi:hypothetical protein ACJQWK_00972 [Exserohilum turcicum]|uniref:Uncharacterized protein n=1 Tax=Exserohilum turcicum (strain 28A) TaxID=671987 RepID=R0K439_EXST2|nr:uncharacterized protein SETTUDRAFT_42956 [Exserohilum turcica Et28A]EOA84339.1 hypothetical protein SETTUDRAFT_42956 [Exserohilum turcica Et28A]